MPLEQVKAFSASEISAMRSSSSAHLEAWRNMPEWRTAVAASMSFWLRAVDMKGIGESQVGLPPRMASVEGLLVSAMVWNSVMRNFDCV